MRLFFLFATVIPAILACSCYFAPAQHQFCNAHWVSHLKVLSATDPGPADHGDRLFNVTHIEVFKHPADLATLPEELASRSSESLCGLNLKLKGDGSDEFLLAGYWRDGTLRIDLCGQIAPDRGMYAKNYRWEAFPAGFAESLKKIQCPKV